MVDIASPATGAAELRPMFRPALGARPISAEPSGTAAPRHAGSQGAGGALQELRLGFTWSMLQPLFLLVVYTAVFAILGAGFARFAIWVLCGC